MPSALVLSKLQIRAGRKPENGDCRERRYNVAAELKCNVSDLSLMMRVYARCRDLSLSLENFALPMSKVFLHDRQPRTLPYNFDPLRDYVCVVMRTQDANALSEWTGFC